MALPTDPDVQAFLRGSLIVQVATLSPKGRPFVTPLWFVVDRGALYITTGAESRAGKNVGQHPGVVLLFSGEGARDRRVTFACAAQPPAIAACRRGGFCAA